MLKNRTSAPVRSVQDGKTRLIVFVIYYYDAQAVLNNCNQMVDATVSKNY